MEVCEAIEGPFISLRLPTDGLTASSQQLIENTLSDIADDQRRRFGSLTLNALQLSN
jgi:hypothetical protein